jgi:Ni/Fe-hydrogenase 1 B-type cytochrome subunit
MTTTTSETVTTRPAAPAEHARPTVKADEERVRVYVWEMPVRITHWVTFGSIVVLIATGFYIADPFVRIPDVSLMAIVRWLHMMAAFVFVASGLVRVYWMFRGNRWARWSAFIPTNRPHFRDLFRQAGWYGFLRRDPPHVVGHNPLAAASYLVIFAAFLAISITGFSLAGMNGTEPWATLFGWVPAILFGPQGVRLVHHLLMWAVIVFLVHHLYAAVLVDTVERSGLISSIFTGYKYFRRHELEDARDGGIIEESGEDAESEPREPSA